MSYNGRQQLVHRLAYEVFVGPIGDMRVLHRCDNPPCFNPEHLFRGSLQDNTQDMLIKGRSNHERGDAHWRRRRPEDVPRGETHPSATFTEDEIRAIRADPRGVRKIAAELGRSPGTISSIRQRRSWKHVA